MVRTPAAAEASEHEPAADARLAIVQVAPRSSFTTTEPDAMPVVAETATETEYDCPVTDGSGVIVPIEVAAGDFGVTAFDAVDGALVAVALVARTVNVYDVPFVSPVTVMGEAVPLAVMPPGLEVTV
jgi:hypothetical protein